MYLCSSPAGSAPCPSSLGGLFGQILYMEYVLRSYSDGVVIAYSSSPDVPQIVTHSFSVGKNFCTLALMYFAPLLLFILYHILMICSN